MERKKEKKYSKEKKLDKNRQKRGDGAGASESCRVIYFTPSPLRVHFFVHVSSFDIQKGKEKEGSRKGKKDKEKEGGTYKVRLFTPSLPSLSSLWCT